MAHLLKYIFIMSVFFLSNLNAQNDDGTSPGNGNIFQQLAGFKNSSGVGIELGYKGDVFTDVSGGMERKGTYLDNFDFIFNFDLKEIFGWNGASFKTHILGNHGGDPTEYAGAAQGISNIAAFHTWKLYEIQLEQNFLNNDLSILAGLYDLNSEFDVRETSSIFINPSHGIGADYALTGQNGPSIFPNTSLALRVRYNISPSFDIKAAVFDGIPGHVGVQGGTHIHLDRGDGFLLSSEVTYKSESEDFNGDYFKCSAGGWYYTSKFEKLSGPDAEGNPLKQTGNYGAYISAEKFLYSESLDENQGLAGFVRIGFADNNVNQVNGYYGAGFSYTGLIPGRDEDVIGLAIASIHNNSKFIDLMAQEDFRIENFEHIIELTYILNVADWLKIQPDFQFVMNPANCNCNNYSFVSGTRLEIAL